MSDILQDFPIAAAPDRVFDTISSPEGLDQWWTLRSSGRPEVGTSYELDFGPSDQWRAEVTRSDPGSAFELRMTSADSHWAGTVVGFELQPSDHGTHARETVRTRVRSQHFTGSR